MSVIRTLPAREVMETVRDGDEIGWEESFRMLLHDSLIVLAADVSVNGLREPITVGPDMRL